MSANWRIVLNRVIVIAGNEWDGITWVSEFNGDGPNDPIRVKLVVEATAIIASADTMEEMRAGLEAAGFKLVDERSISDRLYPLDPRD